MKYILQACSMRCSVNISGEQFAGAMPHLIRFTKRARGIVFSLRCVIVASGRRKLKSSVRRTFYATPRRGERQKVQHMRARNLQRGIACCALAGFTTTPVRGSITSWYDSFSHFETWFNRLRESRVPPGDLARIRSPRSSL